MGEQRRAAGWLRPGWQPWAAALLGSLASIALWQTVLAAEDRAIRARLEARALQHAGAIERQLASDLSAVQSLAAVFELRPRVSREEFRTVTAHLLARHPSLRALGWNPRIRRSERDAWEAEMRRVERHDYRITERSPSGEMVPAGDRPDYYVVSYLEPYAGNEEALGFDVGSEPRRRAALERAAASGEQTLTTAILLVQDDQEKAGFLVFRPHYRNGSRSAPDWRDDLVGFAVGVFRVEDIVEAAVPRLDPGEMGVLVEELVSGQPPRALHASRPAGDADAELVSHYRVGVRTLENGGVTWRVSFAPTRHGLAAERTWFPTAALLAGLLFTASWSVSLAGMQRQASRMEALAESRAREIAQRKRAEEERRRLDAKLREAQRLESLGVLAGGVAHDFNNLLTGVLGNAELALQELPADDPLRPELDEIRLAAVRAADLTRQLLAYAGQARVVPEPIDLGALAEEMTRLLRASISKKADLHSSLAPDLPAIEGDPTQIRQVLMNLITNASDALGSGPGGISIRTGVFEAETSGGDALDASGGRFVFVEVSDTGCGMDEKTRERIFDPFFTTKFPGRGLGLAAVQGIVRSHGGRIRVDSEHGAGTTITLLFPALSAPVEARPAPPATQPAEGRGTVLLVDDEAGVRSLGARVVSRLGFAVLTAADGVEGVELFRAHADEIVAVVLDATMPRMGGVEAMHAIRALRPGVPTVLASGYDREASLRGVPGDPPEAFLAKPFTPAELTETLGGVLSGHR